jgi:hypothetical protein
MVVSITLILLFLAAFSLIGLRLSRSSASYSWLAATLGALLAWVSVLFWQINLPQKFTPSAWSPGTLFTASPSLLADAYGWLYALCLVALAAAVLLTSPARTDNVTNPAAWVGTLAITTLGVLAVLADNPLTLVLVWMAMDLAEFFNTLRASDSAVLSERTVTAFFVRSMGTGLALWASVVNTSSGRAFSFENAAFQPGIFLLMAAGLRLGVLPLHLTFRSEPVLRRGFGTTLRLATAASSLILLARLPFSAIDSRYAPLLLGLAAIAALYSSWKWLSAPDAIHGRPYWIIGMSALSLAAALRGSSAGSAAWGAAMLLFGGIAFLYSSRQIWVSHTLAGLGILMLGLPFSLTGSAWQGSFSWPFLFWPLFLAAHLMLVIGYIAQMLKAGDSALRDLPAWARASYPLGLAVLLGTAILAGVWGWPGALQVGAWQAAVILLLALVLLGLAAWRIGFITRTGLALPASPGLTSRLGDMQDLLVRLAWVIYRILGRLFDYAASLLEGDGGLLWTLVLLLLLISILNTPQP